MDPLDALVTSAARARVLALFYGQPGRELYQQQVARETGLPLLSVQRELRRLGGAEILRVREVGGRRLFSANPDSPIHRELQAIVLKLRGAAGVIDRRIAEIDGVQLAWLFGSYAAGTAGGQSDIDLMVVGSAAPRRLRAALSAAERELDRSINEHVIEPGDWTARLARGDAFLREVRRSPRTWLTGSEAELRKLDPRQRR